MYVRIRKSGNIGIGRGTYSDSEIMFNYAEAKEVAAAFEKLAQTAGKYKHSYKKIGAVGESRTIKFGRTENNIIIVSGDGQTFFCVEDEIRDLIQLLKKLPPMDVAPSSDYVHKIKLDNGVCIAVTNNGNTIKVTLQEAALLKVALESSMESMYYKDIIPIENRRILMEKDLHLKWKLILENNAVEFESYQIEAVMEGLQNSIMDVLTDTIKSLSTDSMVDVRVKSKAKRIEKDTLKILSKNKKVKDIAGKFAKTTGRVLTPKLDADMQTEEFIEMCRFVYSELDSKYLVPLFDLFDLTFLPDML